VFYNISCKYSGFVRSCVIQPSVQVVLTSDFGLDLLSNSDIVFLDGTFDTTEDKLILTVFLGMHDGVAIPGAFMLSKLRDTDTYTSFFEVLYHPNS
jgi:hypothetical protein